MLNLIDSIVDMMAVGIIVVAISASLDMSFAKRIGFGAIAGAWVGLAAGLGEAGVLAFAPNQPVPVIGLLNAAPVLVVGVLSLSSRAFRVALMAIPTSLLIGLNIMRVLGVLFLLLMLDGRLSGPFPYFAGLGDIITGVFAVPLALMAALSQSLPKMAIARWNIFGAIDLILAIGLGITSANGSPLQLFHSGVGSEAMQLMPFCLVPTVLVPFYFISHIIIAAQVMTQRSTGRLAHA